MDRDRPEFTETEFSKLMQNQAQALRVDDLFLFRRVRGERFAHLGGLGRGVGWAGIVELDLADNEMAAKAYRNNTIERRSYDPAGHVMSAYHARSAVAVPVNNDVLVVAGSLDQEIALDADDADWRHLAEQAMTAVRFVSPAKRLADELEILHAVQAIATLDADCEIENVLREIVTIAADSLVCEVGLAWLDDGIFAANEGAQSMLSGTDVDTLLDRILAVAPRPVESDHCEQDAQRRMLPAPLNEMASSWFLLRLPEPASGWMLLVHSTDAARGFSNLCQELARKIPQAASGVLATAFMHRNLRADARTAWAQAERDILTNVGNRTAWNRAVAAEQPGVDGGRQAAILILDIDDLKAANDHYGHDVGDRVIAATAATLVAQLDEDQTVARLGGDEFALLLPDFDAARTNEMIARIRQALHDHPQIEGQIPLRASLGACAASPGTQLCDAMTQADHAMYAEKLSGQPRDCVKLG